MDKGTVVIPGRGLGNRLISLAFSKAICKISLVIWLKNHECNARYDELFQSPKFSLGTCAPHVYDRYQDYVNGKSIKDIMHNILHKVINTKKYPLTKLSSTLASETSKLLENTYRTVNIAFIAEWTRYAEKVGIDLFEVIQAIQRRPTHKNIRYPGIGIGGYCLTKDPAFTPAASKELLKQNQYSPLTVSEQVVLIYAGVKGFLDNIELQKIKEFEKNLLSKIKDEKKDILENIQSTGKLDEETEKSLKEIIENLNKG